MTKLIRRRVSLRRDEGFTLVVAIGVMFVASLLVVAAFTAAEGDVNLSHRDTTGKQAYYAALAGIQAYEYQLEANPDYWESCETVTGTAKESSSTSHTTESYVVKPLGRMEGTETEPRTCSATEPFKTMIQKNGAAANTFRVESTGTAGASKRSIVASFKVKGFLNYVYFTHYEDEDPGLYNAPKECEEKYYTNRPSSGCSIIVFVTGDQINGPMHTDDAPAMCGSPAFGRAEHSPPDTVEFGHAPYEGCGEALKPTYNTASKTYSIGPELLPPESDNALGKYVKEESSSDEFTGVTHLVLNGSTNTIEVTNGGKKETLPWPADGLIYVKTKESTKENENGSCPEFKPQEADTSTEVSEIEKDGCGDVYVSGTYSKSLTIGSQDDVIVNGELYPTSVAGKLGAEPTGTETLGLIANNYVRVYHPIESAPCEEYNYYRKQYERCSGYNYVNGTGSLKNPWIYAAILSTKHSFVVDNYGQGESLGNLNVYGAIAQNYRGIVGTTGGTGYIKNYNYDERLAVDEPPYFLNPLNAGWKVVRETSPASSNAAP
jgi:hypothetical protein